jgi:GxxExxY protein
LKSSGFLADGITAMKARREYLLGMKTITDDRNLNDLTYKLNGLAMRVHGELGMGCLEVVYKDALEYEYQQDGIAYEREKEYVVIYRGVPLKHKFKADFIVERNVVIEAKAQNGIAYANYKQTINYLAITKCPLALLYNFNAPSLEIKRVILTPKR